MAALAITAVGAAVGGSWGALAGSILGSVLFPTKMAASEGPRLGDLRVQSSALGNPIPIPYGAVRLAGNMIWSEPILETAHKKRKRSKRGANQTTYTYSQSFAIAICEGEIQGIRRIWANGKLLYNTADTAAIASVVASNNSGITFRVYTGSETQTADSLIEADVGAANCPAYRGIAYIVFENLPLAEYGNRTPNLEFEVVSAGSFMNIAGTMTEFDTPTNPRGVAYDSLTQSMWVLSEAESVVLKFNTVTGDSSSISVGEAPWGIAFDNITFSMWVANRYSGTVSKINVFTGVPVNYPVAGAPTGVAFDSLTASIWVTNEDDNTVNKFNIFNGTSEVLAVGAAPAGVCYDSLTSSIWVCNAGDNTVSKLSVITGNTVIFAAGSTPAAAVFEDATGSVWVCNIDDLCVSKFDALTGARTDYADQEGNIALDYDPVTNSIWVANRIYNVVTRFNVFTGESEAYPAGDEPSGVAFDPSTNSIWVTNNSGENVSKMIVLSYGQSADVVDVASVVSDICLRAGLSGADIDVTDLTESLDGYIVTRSSARSQIEQLAQAYYFDVVESAGVIKFVPRGGAAVAAIDEDDLAARPFGSETPPSLTLTRKQEMELPVELSVQYMETDAAYAVGTQSSQRLTTSSQNKQSVELALAMSATKAKQIADVLMYDAWTARTAFDLVTGWKYAHLEPTDVITVTKGGRTYTARLVSEDASGGLFARQAVLEDTSVYTQTATAASLPVPADTVDSVPLTALLLLDIPLLRDHDDRVGFYVAACGYTDAWTGAQLYKSGDAGATWDIFGDALVSASSIGVASTALGDFTQNIFDEQGSVTVTMRHGELASDTEINVLNGANLALLGDELIQYRTATLVSTGIYTLTGLLRGRFGTEWARSTHAAGDDFVVLETDSIAAFVGAVAEYDLERQYRAVSFNNFLDDAITLRFTNTAVAQTPLSPVQLGGGRNAALDLTINWVRRTRLSGGWNNYADVPLGEDSEAYEVEIYSSATYVTLKRTITGISSATTSYTAAQQTTDFGSTQATVYFIVYQLSATVGRGYAARGVV